MAMGERIKSIRSKRGMKACEVASLLGISASAISRIESGENEPTASNLRKLCLGLNVSADFLLELSHNPKPPSGFDFIAADCPVQTC